MNYLKLIDYQVGNNNYSNAVINNFLEPLKKEILSKRLVIKTPNKKKTLEEILPKIEDNQASGIIQKFFKLLKSIFILLVIIALKLTTQI